MHLPRTTARTGAQIIYAAALLLFIGVGVASPAKANTFVVTTVADPGDGACTAANVGDGCTLREAIAAANSAAGTDAIDATGISGTIQLTGVLPDLSTDIDIKGPGAKALIVRRNTGGNYRIFTVSTGAAVNISGLAVTNGRTPDGLNAPNLQTGGGAGDRGGGIWNRGTLTITACTVSGNRTGNGGAGGYGPGGSGGGICNSGTLIISHSTVSDNMTGDGGGGRPGGGGGLPGGPGGFGGGIANENGAATTLVNSTVSGNRTGVGGFSFGGNQAASGYGGGISNGGTLTVSNSTISGNETRFGGGVGSSYGFGGGIDNVGTLTIGNSTIVGNQSYDGGGIYRNQYGGIVTIRSTIVASNVPSGGSNILGSVQSDGYNLIGDSSGTNIHFNPGAGPDIYGPADLDPLADNGGPTRTHLPRSNSRAIDNGKNFSASSTDQRGNARIVDLRDAAYPNAADGTDIGAVELAPVIARNISTRAKIEAADNVLIAGFIITGTLPKKVLIRGLGPSLSDANVPGVLGDPDLELRASNGALIRGNDNWQDDPAQVGEVQATGLAPTRTQESAIVLTLVPSTYTAIVRGKNHTTGIGLVEVYDVGNANSELANMSARGVIESSDNVMIGGFTMSPGDGNTNLILRALGPSLATLGINNSLADPTLDVRDANGNQISFNDNWQDDSVKAAQISAKGLSPVRDSESAIPLTFGPGQYTAIVRGKNNGTGVGLIEIYQTH